MAFEKYHVDRAVIPTSFGLGVATSGQYFLGLISTSIGVIFSLRFLELFLKERAAEGRYSSDPVELFYEKVIDTVSDYSQQIISVFFACCFWMVQGDLQLLTFEHWQVGFSTAFYAANTLLIIKLSPLKFIMEGNTREFISGSLIVSLVDNLVHPSHFGGAYTEAIVTGVSAVGMNMVIDALFVVFSHMIII